MFNRYSGIFYMLMNLLCATRCSFLYLTIFSFFRRHRHAWLNMMAELQETIVPWYDYSHGFDGSRKLDAGDVRKYKMRGRGRRNGDALLSKP